MDNFSLFDFFGWNFWGRPEAVGPWPDILILLPFALGFGLIPASVQILGTLLVSLAIPSNFMAKLYWLARSRFAAVAFCLILFLTIYALGASLLFRAGNCQSLEQLGIDDIDWAYKCTGLPRDLSNSLNDSMGWIALLSFGWPHLLCVAGILEWAARHPAPTR